VLGVVVCVFNQEQKLLFSCSLPLAEPSNRICILSHCQGNANQAPYGRDLIPYPDLFFLGLHHSPMGLATFLSGVFITSSGHLKRSNV